MENAFIGIMLAFCIALLVGGILEFLLMVINHGK